MYFLQSAQKTSKELLYTIDSVYNSFVPCQRSKVNKFFFQYDSLCSSLQSFKEVLRPRIINKLGISVLCVLVYCLQIRGRTLAPPGGGV